MQRGDDQELWDLLGRVGEPKVSPFFVRNVVREVRGLAQDPAPRPWFSIRRLLPVASVGVAVIAVLFLHVQTSVDAIRESEGDMLTNVDPQDFEVVLDLNDVVASDEIQSLEESILH